MVHISIIEAQLSRLGVKVSRWFRPEIRELENILMDGEDIVGVVPGRYFGGYAILIATDRRLLLIDKKTFFMNLEDIRFDTISEVDFSTRVMDSTVTVYTLNKQHRFSTTKYKRHLRSLTAYVQQQVVALRQQQYQPMPNPQPQQHHFSADFVHHLSRPSFLRSPNTHKLVGATAMLASHRASIGGFPATSFTAHTNRGVLQPD